ncbi:MAG: hypothetical protein ACRDZ9_01525 [Acidimicrobiales bacterium]
MNDQRPGPQAGAWSGLDRRALVVGGLAAVAIALPLAALGQAVLDSRSTNLAFPFLMAVLAGFATGGYVAARRAPARPLVNGALAALGAFAAIQGLGVVRRLAAGEEVRVARIAYAGLLAYSSGLVGALLARRRHLGRRRTAHR